jgi:hypothetical protein
MPEKPARPIREPDRLFAPQQLVIEKKADGSTCVRSAQILKPFGRSVGKR